MKLNLALQGGGAHGAFTWGVLDRLLEEEDIEIEGVSGTSAGAINAIVLVEGMIEGGRAGARAQLEDFWREVARAAAIYSPFRRNVLDVVLGRYTLNNSPLSLYFLSLARAFSPYQFNPANMNPLRDLLDRFINYELVRRQDRIKLFINATHVATGALRIFREHEVNTDVVLASTTLPLLFQTPIINGEGYWDGGYIANPAIEPMIAATRARDVLIVQLNPIARPELPTSADDILERLNEITFNASLITELRFIGERNRLIETGELSPARHPKLNLHMVHGDQQLASYRNTKLLAEEAFILLLRDLGRAEMDEFLRVNKSALGQRSSFDYHAMITQMMENPQAA